MPCGPGEHRVYDLPCSAHERATAEQFAADLMDLASDISECISAYVLRVGDGERGCPRRSVREEMLDELSRWAIVAKQLKDGSL